MSQKEISTYDTGGRARKGCPNCKKYVHARVYTCACGHSFKTISNNRVLDTGLVLPLNPKFPAPYDEFSDKIDALIIEPAGNCPIELKTPFNADDLKEWVEKLRTQLIEQEGAFLTNRAIRHWAGVAFNPKSTEYTDISGFLMSEVQDVQFRS